MTLHEAYLGIDPDLDLWKYFFRVCRPQDPEAELMTTGDAVIHVKSGHRADPYLEIPMPRSMKGWRKKWFYLKNDDFAPLPVFTIGRSVPLASWRKGWLGRTLARYNPYVSTFSSCGMRGRPGLTSCGCYSVAGSNNFGCERQRCGHIQGPGASTILALKS
jgi:hypothetical protein